MVVKMLENENNIIKLYQIHVLDPLVIKHDNGKSTIHGPFFSLYNHVFFPEDRENDDRQWMEWGTLPPAGQDHVSSHDMSSPIIIYFNLQRHRIGTQIPLYLTPGNFT